jgi:hypothetical protein
MKTQALTRRIIGLLAASTLLLGSTGMAVEPKDFSNKDIQEMWTELWGKTGLKIDPITQDDALKKYSGHWVCMFGVGPQKLNITLTKDHKVETSGKTEDKPWKRTGDWKVVSNKIVLFMPEDPIPSLIFSIKGKLFIYDPWSKTAMSQLERSVASSS